MVRSVHARLRGSRDIDAMKMECLSDSAAAAPPDAARPILVVDDSRAQRAVVVRLLEKWGLDVVEARCGVEALAICKAERVELVISDWMMPGMDGLDLCRKFRDLRGRGPGYILLLTAQSESARVAEGLDSGADDFLSKPVIPVELRARLRAGQRILETQRAVTSKNLLLTKALDELTQVYSAIERDLDEARKLQAALVPDRRIAAEGADISLYLRPSGKVGGDLVGAFRIGPGRYGVYSIDVAGHGIASALLVARVAGYFSADSVDHNIALDRAPDGQVMMSSPDEVCLRLNQLLLTDSRSDHYLTMILADCDFNTGKVSLCQAGHPSPMVQRAGGQIEFPSLFGMPVGLFEAAEYASYSITLQAGDRLMLFTDGMTECADPTGALLEEEGLKAFAHSLADQRGEGFVDAMVERLQAFQGADEFDDDVSAAVIEMT